MSGGRIAAVRTEKEPILRANNYSYNFDRMVYYNRSARKAFSVEWLEDHSEAELQKYICEDTAGGEWRFYFNSEPSAAVKREIESVLG